MDHCSKDLCSECLRMVNDGAIWHDSSRVKKQPNSTRLSERNFRDVVEKSATCRLCRLALAALSSRRRRKTISDVLEPDTTIYYARITYARFGREDSVSADTIPQSTSHDQDPGVAGFRYTYRLRVSANYQYNFKPSHDFEFVRDLQSRPCDGSFSVPYPDIEGEIMLLCEQGDDDRFFNGRRMDTCFDFNLAKRWIHDCVTKHEPIEQGGALPEQRSPNRVIDVCSRRLIWAPQGCLYAALSYSWGPPEISQVRLNKYTEKFLEEPQGLNEVPKTIHDAFLVCEKLDIKYLWVDVFCRHQGEEGKSLAEKIENISNIFASAYLTIVGGGFDSHCGLFHVDHPSPRQSTEQIGDLHLAVSQPPFDEAMRDSPWSQRLWPFDENNRSKRLLYFFDRQVLFTCKCQGERPSFYCEDMYLESTGIKVTLPYINDLWTKHDIEDFNGYVNHVMEYVGRQVTKPEDRKRAFKGSKIKLETGLGKVYIHDLPVKYFARALCFELHPRVYLPTEHGSPSWSWQGWQIPSNDFYYDSAGGMDFHISIFYRAEKQPGAGQFQFVPIKDYDFDDFSSNDLQLAKLYDDIQGGEFFNVVREVLKSKYEGSEGPNLRAHAAFGMKCVRGFPASEILDTLSAEENRQLIAFFTVTTDLCFTSMNTDGEFKAIMRPGRENVKLGQGWLNTGARYGAGRFKCIFIGESDGNGLFFLAVKEVKENVYSRVGSCAVLGKDKPKLRDTVKLEMIYLI
ncbi:uncharacterized protein BDW47DRAFT_78023 [Aspergillus candidus]|uniref:Heterokaryon incompatibility domain-containing protein n=1 Tax=Aspergillus candidus TaxID=41067 RepID=A0A2I2F1D3_ASPCN|nr:hypothetical protein BDW47DRAFT_78023 [Aspergillus candidus]PLB34429.1 hypothetical protein BDW47DRAFT_78023 [Aspergillus candidus]